jgi:hypothetical protein
MPESCYDTVLPRRVCSISNRTTGAIACASGSKGASSRRLGAVLGAAPDYWPGQMPTSWSKPKAQNSKTEIVGSADGPCDCRRQPSATLTPATSLFFYSSEEEITHGRLVRAPDCHSDRYDDSRCNRCGVSALDVDMVKDKHDLWAETASRSTSRNTEQRSPVTSHKAGRKGNGSALTHLRTDTQERC